MRLHSLATLAPLTALLALALTAGCGGGSGGVPGPRTIGGDRSLTIRMQPGSKPETLAQELGATITDRAPESGIFRLRLPNTVNPALVAQQLRHDPRLASAEENDEVGTAEAGVEGNPIHVPFDFVRAHDANYDAIGQGGSVNQNVYTQIHLGQAHEISRGAGVVVAVLDTGVAANHTSLSGHLLPGYNAIDESQPPDDIQDGVTNAEWGHGTMVAGIIVRLAPDAKILPVRVLNADGSGTVIDVVQGIHWAVTHGAKVINPESGHPLQLRCASGSGF